MRDKIIEGDCLEVLKGLPAGIVDCVVTSPPYWGLRDYGTGEWEGGDPACDHTKSMPSAEHEENIKRRERLGYEGHGGWEKTAQRGDGKSYCPACGAKRIDKQIGLEATFAEWLEKMVEVFREVRRVMKDEASLWVNCGDGYNGTGNTGGGDDGKRRGIEGYGAEGAYGKGTWTPPRATGLKPKDLIGMPWRLAFALQADGWYLRSDIIWSKPNPMPESVTDRPTKSHEYLFLLTKQPRYYYDAEAIREKAEYGRGSDPSGNMFSRIGHSDNHREGSKGHTFNGGRNKRDVWWLATQPFPESHFATMPEALVEPCIRAGTSQKGYCPECGKPWIRVVEREIEHTQKTHTVGWKPSCECGGDPVPGIILDPFMGSGTVGLVAKKLGRDFLGIELNPEYIEIAERRLDEVRLFL